MNKKNPKIFLTGLFQIQHEKKKREKNIGSVKLFTLRY